MLKLQVEAIVRITDDEVVLPSLGLNCQVCSDQLSEARAIMHFTEQLAILDQHLARFVLDQFVPQTRPALD